MWADMFQLRFSKAKQLLLITIALLLIVIFVLDRIDRSETHDKNKPGISSRSSVRIAQQSLRNSSKPRLALIVPFRDRFDELLVFVPYMTDFLRRQDIGPFEIFIINQSHKYRFNRGALANVGYLIARNRSDYIAIHDIDILPMNENLSYAFPEKGPYHLSSPEYHPQYNYSKYFGGVLLISNTHFEMVNGMSNRYFGWGLEDDEFYSRILAAKLPISRPVGLSTNKTNTFMHFHGADRKRDSFKTKDQREILRRRDRLTGLSNLRYMISRQHKLTLDEGYRCQIFNVEIDCDREQDPWCVNSYVRQNHKGSVARTMRNGL